MPEPLPEIDRGGLVLADLAWVETPGSMADKTKAAIRAYIWAADAADRNGFYPSLAEWRRAAGQVPA